jgi:hypothetical protein
MAVGQSENEEELKKCEWGDNIKNLLLKENISN